MFAVGECQTALGRALVTEQFRILTNQIPVLYAMLLLVSISVGLVLPPTVNGWLRFAVPGLLLTVSVVRMVQWIRLRGRELAPAEAWRYLSKMRYLAGALNVGFLFWTLALFEAVDQALRAPITLLVFMGSIGSAYCLGSFPSASRLTLLIAGLPIAVRLMISGEPLLLSIGINLCFLLALLLRMMNTNFGNFVRLIELQARARAAEISAVAEQAKAREIADRFQMALGHMSQGLCFFDGERRLIVCNRRYLEIYGLQAESVRPGMQLTEIVELRYRAGTGPLMSKNDYLNWRNSEAIINKESDTVVELATGRVVRIWHRPTQDNGWVATHEDITERYRTERALAEAKAAAEQAEAAARAAHTHLTEALDVVPEGLAIFDKEDRLVLWNRQYADLFPASAAAIAQGARFEDILRAGVNMHQYPDAEGREEDWIRARLSRHSAPQNSHEQLLPGDRWMRVEERRTANGGSIGIRIDITDLKRSEASFRLLFEENPLPMWVADTTSRRLLAVNAAMCEHYGYQREELLALSERDLSHNGGYPAGPETIVHKTSCGELIEVVIESRPLTYQGQAGLVSVAFDVTERNRAEQRVRHLASHDILTDLPNRAALDGRLSALLQQPDDRCCSFAVLCIDLDHFKEINDLFGHSIGDAVLQEASRRLQQAGPGAFVARAGGDEFIALVEQLPLPGSAELLASRMTDAFKPPIEIDGHSLEVDLSIGIAIYPRDGESAESLLANADAALYRAKHEGRGGIRIFTGAMDQQLRYRRAMEHDLRSAVDNGELYLEYQPQLHRDGKITGFEALVRWQHPVRGIVPPGEFIPVAEKSGAITKIDEWVLRDACRQASSWDETVRIAVNVSAAQFRRENLEHQVRAALHDTGLSPARLELEITEGVLIEDISRASQTLKSLKSLGVMIALDDFGTGYSSLSYLQAFPLDRIKIDRSFVTSLGSSARSLAIVRAVIGLAHGFDVPVLAEGVETNEQLSILMRERCDDMQGYLIGRPQNPELYSGQMKASANLCLKTAS